MLQAHSFLWNYLSIAPNLVFLVVGFLLWKRGLARQAPAFLAFTIIGGLGALAVVGADFAPFVSPGSFWFVCWVVLLLEALLKFLVIGEVLAKLLGMGAFLVLLAALFAGFAHGDSQFRVISGYHLLEQTVFVIELGLVVCLLLFAAHFHLSWDRLSFGILLGLGVSACVHLATWAVVANASPSEHTRTLFDFLKMATYHLAVLIWLYYVLAPQKAGTKSEVPLPENNLAVWNRELERLLQQ